MNKIKIIATIGDASSDIDTLTEFINLGVDCFRINSSKNSLEECINIFNTIDALRYQLNENIPVLLDLYEPKIKLTGIRFNPVTLKYGDIFTFVCSDSVIGSNTHCGVTYKNLYNCVNLGDKLLVNDGQIAFSVNFIKDNTIRCICLSNCTLEDGFNLNIEGKELDLNNFSFIDKNILDEMCNLDFDFISIPSVHSKEDVFKYENYLDILNRSDVKIFSKISDTPGVDNIDEIIMYSHGIILDTDTLALTYPIELIPSVQKDILKKCSIANIPGLLIAKIDNATIGYPVPTRSEVSDIFTGICDSADGFIFGKTTSSSKHPIEVIKSISMIFSKGFDSINLQKLKYAYTELNNIDYARAIAESVCDIALKSNVKAIIVPSESGENARVLSMYRPKAPIVALTHEIKLARYLSVKACVSPLICEKSYISKYDMVDKGREIALKYNICEKLDTIIIVSSLHNDVYKSDLFKIETV